MIPELGHFALIVALCIAIVQAVVPLVGSLRGNAAWMAVARPAAQGQFVFVAIAFGCLAYSFVHNDFSVLNVASNSNSSLPVQYRFAATWGSHEGSLLLWVTMLTVWMLAVTVFSRQLPREMLARVLAVMAMISVGFLTVMLFTSNPFERLLPAAPDGRDLNPLLQDPGMVIHPPMLYMGYVGMSVVFAFAIAALISGRLDAAWARWSRPWTTMAWAFLTVGICLGSAWAYYELGWGGWWFWDPVENASLMPWLALAALLHVQVVRDLRGRFAHWSALLALAGFVLALLGTFLVRSGVLTSVHAFASDPRRGSVMLALIAAAMLASFGLWARHAARLRPARAQGAAPLSRDTALALNNLLLVVACASVLLGTLYPLAMDALGLGKLSVGAPYFDAVMAPLLLPALALLLPAAGLRWGRDEVPALWRRLRPTVVALALGAGLLPVLLMQAHGRIVWGTALALWLAIGVAASTLDAAVRRLRESGPGGFGASAAGMVLAHLGVAVFVVGVAMVKGYGIERDVRLAPGETHRLADCQLRFEQLGPQAGPNYSALVGRFRLDCPDQPARTLLTEKRAYVGSAMPMTESAIDGGLTRDLYVALGESVGGSGPDAAWSVRVQVKPFMRWVWLGVLLMAAGALLAATARRLRGPVRVAQAARSAVALAAATQEMPT